jgi:hypothetical protein
VAFVGVLDPMPHPTASNKPLTWTKQAKSPVDGERLVHGVFDRWLGYQTSR